MKKQGNAITVPLSQPPGLGQWDASVQRRDSKRDKAGIDKAKVPVFTKLQRDSKRDSKKARASEVCPTTRQHLGQDGITRAILSPELREWIDRVFVPALVRDSLAGREEDAYENLPSVGDSSTSNRQTPEEAK